MILVEFKCLVRHYTAVTTKCNVRNGDCCVNSRLCEGQGLTGYIAGIDFHRGSISSSNTTALHNLEETPEGDAEK